MPRILLDQLLGYGERPCERCGKPHREYGVERPSGTGRTWADPDDGHPYQPVSWEVVARLLAQQHGIELMEWELPEREAFV